MHSKTTQKAETGVLICDLTGRHQTSGFAQLAGKIVPLRLHGAARMPSKAQLPPAISPWVHTVSKLAKPHGWPKAAMEHLMRSTVPDGLQDAYCQEESSGTYSNPETSIVPTSSLVSTL
ncbi:hypothetical protein CEXT_472351 [Caerostris extrusa]|uniref:Uncharacterized protein n=1 Tax=Caerostris extrusa TaxID=172846 RepID=A0AAV4V8J2_CAEEX|nr:hypothetical protein CEXT_472351 [Caerostris extrusa]